MLELGRINRLRVAEVDAGGAWLVAETERAFLEKREVPARLSVGDEIDVFVYNDLAGNAVATLRRPLAEVGECALMKALQVNRHGAFMDWGLFKDLLVPPKEQPEPMKPGRRYVVKVRLDRQGRPLGTARIDQSLVHEDVSLKEGQQVDLLVWRFTPLGVRVVVNQRFDGLLYRDEVGDRLNYGDALTGYVKKIRADGKLDITLHRGARAEIDVARDKVLETVNRMGGFLPLHDGSAPDEIRTTLGMSKKLFKKAIGGLYKDGVVELTERGVRLKRNQGPAGGDGAKRKMS